jgi:thiamine biosynthesis lipoprotein
MKYSKIIIFSLISAFFIFYSPKILYSSVRLYTISGQSMGTFYTIKFVSKKKESLSLWKDRVDIRLSEVNKKLSMYDPKSELSLFNRQQIKMPVDISHDFYSILLIAQKLYHLTDGSWDGTVKPLVDLWGFGINKKIQKIPESKKITMALVKTGFNKIEINEEKRISKKTDITLDLGSIAKGYGVDAVASIFLSSGINDILVEIGGELYAAGKNKKGNDWAVGISKPDKHYSNQGLYKIIGLKNRAIATSGNYRIFFELNNKSYSHIIDPKTGYPVDNKIVSASVIAKDCTFADGLATALMVMGIQKAISLVNSLEDTECLIIQEEGKQLIDHVSENFNAFVIK